jgi:hypothetical protein
MALWKNPQDNSVHDDMDGTALSLPIWPQGMVQITQAEADVLLAPPPPTLAQVFAQAEVAVQTMLDDFAKTWQYESILSAASYAYSTVPKFKAEALALVAWRDAVWSTCYVEMAAIQGGTQAMPSSVQVFVSSLPSSPVRPD